MDIRRHIRCRTTLSFLMVLTLPALAQDEDPTPTLDVNVRNWIAEQSVEVRNPGIPDELGELAVPVCTAKFERFVGDILGPGRQEIIYRAILVKNWPERLYWEGTIRGWVHDRADRITHESARSSTDIVVFCTGRERYPLPIGIDEVGRPDADTNAIVFSAQRGATVCQSDVGTFPLEVEVAIHVVETDERDRDTVEVGAEGEGLFCLETRRVVPAP